MKKDPRTKVIRNLWSNPAILLDHQELERSYDEFLDRSMQKYDSKRAEMGVLRSQRNVFQFLSKGGLLEQEKTDNKEDASKSSSDFSVTSSLTSTSNTASASSTISSGRPVRSCTTVPAVNIERKQCPSTKEDVKKAPLRAKVSGADKKKHGGSKK